MVHVTLTRGKDGVLVRVKACGHSLTAPRGANLVCGAVSVLMRTAARTLEAEPAVSLGGAAAVEGDLELIVERVPGPLGEWARGITDNLVQGLSDLAAEYPNEVRLDMTTMHREKRHGT